MKRRYFIFILVLISALRCFADTNLKVTEDRVRIRNLPSVKYSEVLGVANTGDSFNCWRRTSVKEEVAGDVGYWYCIRYNDGEAWIFGAFVDLLGKEESDVYGVEKAEAYYNYLCELITKRAEKIRDSSSPTERKTQTAKGNDGSLGTVNIDKYLVDGFEIETFGNTLSYVSLKANIKNVFNIKIGMSRKEIEAIIGKAEYGRYAGGYLVLNYDKSDKLTGFSINYDLYL